MSGVVQGAFANIEQMLGRLAEQGTLAGSATLNVSASVSIASKWLAPRLHRFHALHPHIEVRLEAINRRVDLLRDRSVDIALRYGSGPYDPALSAACLWPPGRMIAVCAPSLIEGGTLRRPHDVLKHSLLRTEQLRPAAAASLNPDPISWQAWMLAAGIKGQVVNGPYFGSTNLALEAAIAGRGLTLSPAILAQDDIQAKRLVIPFAVSLPDPFSYWLLCRGDRIEEVRIRAFTKWIMQEAEASANALANQTS